MAKDRVSRHHATVSGDFGLQNYGLKYLQLTNSESREGIQPYDPDRVHYMPEPRLDQYPLSNVGHDLDQGLIEN